MSFEYRKIIVRQMLKAEPDTLFVFGDNLIGKGYGGQAKEMRGEPNAVGIPTKLLPDMSIASFFRNDDYDRAKPWIDAAFMRLFAHAADGGSIVWPTDDVGTGLAKLPTKAPKIWRLIAVYKFALIRMCNYEEECQ